MPLTVKLKQIKAMLYIYLSHKAFTTSLEQQNKLTPLIKGSYTSIYAADDELWERVNREDSKEFQLYKKNDLEIRFGKDFSEKIKAKGLKQSTKIKTGIASPLFVLGNVTKDMTEEIEKKLGVICISDDSIDIDNYVFTENYSHQFEENEEGGWNNILKCISHNPLNSIVVTDKFLYKDDLHGNNIKSILEILLGQKAYEFSIRVLVFIGERTSFLSDENIKRILLYFHKFEETHPNIKFTIETVNCNNINKEEFPLFEHTHNRWILTNYGCINAEYSLAVFNNQGKSYKLQNIGAGNVLYGEKAPLESLHKIRKTLASDINNLINAPSEKYRQVAEFAEWTWDDKEKDFKKNLKHIKDMTNRLFTELQDGDSCWCLSIGDCNNWYEAKAINKTYDYEHLSDCIVRRDKHEIEQMADEIKKLFSDPKYPQQTDDSKTFYRIHISYPSHTKTIDYVESLPGQKASEQLRNYRNNCFVNEDDAIVVANEICRILGIPPITKH